MREKRESTEGTTNMKSSGFWTGRGIINLFNYEKRFKFSGIK